MTIEGGSDQTVAYDPVLDDFVWASLAGPLRRFAEGDDDALRMQPEIGVFGALRDVDDPACWAALARLLGPEGGVGLFAFGGDKVAEGWTEFFRLEGLQMLGGDVTGDRSDEVVDLGPGDVGDVRDIVARTEPGPFARRTMDLGGFVGIRRKGHLAAVAGQRLGAGGYREISAVCTDPDFRGQGLARLVVRAVVADIVAAGEVPMLHVAGTNTGAIDLYRSMGFVERRQLSFIGVTPPAEEDGRS